MIFRLTSVLASNLLFFPNCLRSNFPLWPMTWLFPTIYFKNLFMRFPARRMKREPKQKKRKKRFFYCPGVLSILILKIYLSGGSPSLMVGAVRVANREMESPEIKITTSDGGGTIFFKSRLYREGIKSQFGVGLNKN